MTRASRPRWGDSCVPDDTPLPVSETFIQLILCLALNLGKLEQLISARYTISSDEFIMIILPVVGETRDHIDRSYAKHNIPRQ